MNKYTASSLKKALKCKGFEQENATSQAMERGSILHDLLSGKEYSTQYSMYKGEKRQYKFEHDIEALEEIVDQVRAEYRDIVELYNSEEILTTEISSLLNENYYLEGIIDRYLVSGTEAHIVDWKSGRSRLKVDDPMDMLQSIVYSLLVFKIFKNVQKISFEYIYIETFYSQELVYERKDMQGLENLIDALVYSIKNVGYNVGEHCKYCNKADKCPLVDETLRQVLYKEIELENLKVYKKIVNNALDLRKETLKETDEGKMMLRSIQYHYVKKQNLQASDLLELVSDEVKINKLKAKELNEKGIETYTKTSLGW
jgi:ATP-dependent exoDNAse (exonuclease V) beta subunit